MEEDILLTDLFGKDMIKEIDNFDIVRNHLIFLSPYDRYVIHIIRRNKDCDKNELGSNESQRLIRTYYVSSVEYYDAKIEAIKELCRNNNARAYILPQVRNNRECLLNLTKNIIDSLDDPSIKIDSLVRKSICGLHKSRDKKWTLDIDADNMIEYKVSTGFPKDKITTYAWIPELVLNFVREQLKEIGKKESEAWMVPTKNGHCIVTSPFNLQKAYEKCDMMFQGIHKVIDENGQKKDITGWVIKDGMVLCYYSDGDNNDDRKM